MNAIIVTGGKQYKVSEGDDVCLWEPSNVPAHKEAEVYDDSLLLHQEYPKGISLPGG